MPFLILYKNRLYFLFFMLKNRIDEIEGLGINSFSGYIVLIGCGILFLIIVAFQYRCINRDLFFIILMRFLWKSLIIVYHPESILDISFILLFFIDFLFFIVFSIYMCGLLSFAFVSIDDNVGADLAWKILLVGDRVIFRASIIECIEFF